MPYSADTVPTTDDAVWQQLVYLMVIGVPAMRPARLQRAVAVTLGAACPDRLARAFPKRLPHSRRMPMSSLGPSHTVSAR